jgi:hypothetical protein
LNIALKQALDGLTTVRNKSLAGQLVNGSYPIGGYYFHIDYSQPSQFVLFGRIQPLVYGQSSYQTGLINDLRTKQFSNVRFIEVCARRPLGVQEELGLPCQSAGWEKISWQNSQDFLEINFNLPDEVLVNYNQYNQDDGYVYLGGVIKHQLNNLSAYFYIDLRSGLVSGDIIP